MDKSEERQVWLATCVPTALQPHREHVWIEHRHPELPGMMSLCGALACRPVESLARQPRIGRCLACFKRISGIPRNQRAADCVALEVESA